MDKLKNKIRIGMVIDFPEERWESMDLVAEMTLMHLKNTPDTNIVMDVITPQYRKIFQYVITGKKWAWNLDRLINRRIVLKNGVLRSLKKRSYDAVYIVDHSYAHLVNSIKKVFAEIPVVVMCHDLDAVSAPDRSKHGLRIYQRLLRWFAGSVRDGLLKSDRIITGSDTVRNALIQKYQHQIQASRVLTNPYGIAEEFHFRVETDCLGLRDCPGPIVLHVGSVIPRKRIDVLLKTLAMMAERYENLVLVRIGGDFTADQKEIVGKLGLEHRIRVMPRLARQEVAEWYRKSDVVLITSEAEGFGLPVIEALACGASVVASDIPVLRETGGSFVRYAPVGDSAEFARIANEVIQENGAGQGVTEGLISHLERYQWPAHLERLLEVLQGEVTLKGNTKTGK